MEEKYFVHPSSFVDEDVEIGEGTKSGTSATFRRGPASASAAPWGRT